MWNPCDAAAIIFFMIGLVLRFHHNTQDIGRVIYCVDSIYWYLRILNILGVNKYLGGWQQLLLTHGTELKHYSSLSYRSPRHNDG